jgi:outer membrane protein assembly factor BamB
VREGREVVLALNADTGKELWTADVGIGKFDKGGDSGAPENSGGDGPRSTPAASGDRVYAFTQDLTLHCLDAASGKVTWKKSLLQEHQGRNIEWKSAMSPLVDGDSVFVGGGGAGQSMLAFNKKTGELLWKSGNETITHATPVAATILGVRQIIYFMKSGLVSVSAADGAELWKFPFRFKVSTASSPVICDDIVYCSAGYGVGGGACKIAKQGAQFTATEMWKIEGDTKVANHWSTPVYKDGYLYGMFSFKKYGTGPLKCVEVKTGQVKWEKPGFGAGNVILADDKVVALADDGQVVLVEANPDAYKEIARAKAVEGKCWSTPALSGGRLYVRSTKEGACLDVAAKLTAKQAHYPKVTPVSASSVPLR